MGRWQGEPHTSLGMGTGAYGVPPGGGAGWGPVFPAAGKVVAVAGAPCHRVGPGHGAAGVGAGARAACRPPCLAPGPNLPEIPHSPCWLLGAGAFCPLPHLGGEEVTPCPAEPVPVPSPPAANRWRGPAARGWGCPGAAVTLGGLGGCRGARGALGPARSQPSPPARTVPCLPGPASSPQETKRLLSGLRPPNRLRFCLADTKGLRGAGGCRGPRQLPRSAACSAGVLGLETHSPLSWGAPRQAVGLWEGAAGTAPAPHRRGRYRFCRAGQGDAGPGASSGDPRPRDG